MKHGGKLLLLLIVLGAMFAWQALRGVWLKSELAERVSQNLHHIRKDNHAEIIARIVEESRAIGLPVAPQQVRVSYEPESQQKFAQKTLAGAAVFENYRAQIVVDAPVKVWGITVSGEPIDRWEIVMERGVWKRDVELQRELQALDQSSGANAPATTRQGLQQRIPAQRPELEKELN